MGLTARHRHRIIEKNFVGHIDLRGDRLSDRHQARMIVRAIADVREDMLLVREGGNTQPWHAFCPHMCEGRGITLHPLRHEVTTDARQGAAPFRHLCRGIVRTTRTEVGRAQEALRIALQGLFARVEELHPVINRTAGMKFT